MFDNIALTTAASSFCEYFRLALYNGGVLPSEDAIQLGDHVQLSRDWDAINFSFRVGPDVDHARLVRCADAEFDELDSFEIFPGAGAGQYICRIQGCRDYVEQAVSCADNYRRSALQHGRTFADWCYWLLRMFAYAACCVLAYYALWSE